MHDTPAVFGILGLERDVPGLCSLARHSEVRSQRRGGRRVRVVGHVGLRWWWWRRQIEALDAKAPEPPVLSCRPRAQAGGEAGRREASRSLSPLPLAQADDIALVIVGGGS